MTRYSCFPRIDDRWLGREIGGLVAFGKSLTGSGKVVGTVRSEGLVVFGMGCAVAQNGVDENAILVTGIDRAMGDAGGNLDDGGLIFGQGDVLVLAVLEDDQDHAAPDDEQLVGLVMVHK